jgi:predicted aspartyl protease
VTVETLIDTGASISIIPLDLAQQIGAWKTNDKIQIIGVNNQMSLLLLCAVIVEFPMFNYIVVGKLIVAVSDKETRPIIGMDIMNPLGITIDTKAKTLSLRNPDNGNLKNILAAIGNATLFVGGIILVVKILEKIFN